MVKTEIDSEQKLNLGECLELLGTFFLLCPNRRVSQSPVFNIPALPWSYRPFATIWNQSRYRHGIAVFRFRGENSLSFTRTCFDWMFS